jgi:restriction system protein
MPELWMVRAGEGGYLVDDFERTGSVAVGWGELGDFGSIRTADEMRRRIVSSYPNMRPGAVTGSVNMALKFKDGIKRGDRVVSYDPEKREYLVGTVAGEYQYAPNTVPDYPNIRRVEWQGRVGRDALSVSARNTLGAIQTLFNPGPDVLKELDSALNGTALPEVTPPDPEETEEEFEQAKLNTLERARELIKDKIRLLSPDDMEQLVAALLRAMGFKATVTPKGADRGVDVRASPDGLGFKQPRIMAEVKHRPKEAMGSEKLRSFAAILRGDDRGLYVSIGGFTQEAKYEAERSRESRITLVDLNELATLVIEHYEQFDVAGRTLLPLVRVYWPT